MKVNPVSEPLPSSSNTNILWTTSLENDEQAREYFWQKKEELDIKGFFILEDFLKDHELPDTFENQNLKSVSTQFFINLRKYTLDTFPSEDAIKNTSSRHLWDTIIKGNYLLYYNDSVKTFMVFSSLGDLRDIKIYGVRVIGIK